jgi:hypothetical protein
MNSGEPKLKDIQSDQDLLQITDDLLLQIRGQSFPEAAPVTKDSDCGPFRASPRYVLHCRAPHHYSGMSAGYIELTRAAIVETCAFLSETRNK